MRLLPILMLPTDEVRYESARYITDMVHIVKIGWWWIGSEQIQFDHDIVPIRQVFAPHYLAAHQQNPLA